MRLDCSPVVPGHVRMETKKAGVPRAGAVLPPGLGKLQKRDHPLACSLGSCPSLPLKASEQAAGCWRPSRADSLSTHTWTHSLTYSFIHNLLLSLGSQYAL